MTPDELHKAVEEGLGPAGRMDNAHEVLWDEVQALRAELSEIRKERDALKARYASLVEYVAPAVAVLSREPCVSPMLRGDLEDAERIILSGGPLRPPMKTETGSVAEPGESVARFMTADHEADARIDALIARQPKAAAPPEAKGPCSKCKGTGVVRWTGGIPWPEGHATYEAKCDCQDASPPPETWTRDAKEALTALEGTRWFPEGDICEWGKTREGANHSLVMDAIEGLRRALSSTPTTTPEGT